MEISDVSFGRTRSTSLYYKYAGKSSTILAIALLFGNPSKSISFICNNLHFKTKGLPENPYEVHFISMKLNIYWWVE
jgi:hypothetical protein